MAIFGATGVAAAAFALGLGFVAGRPVANAQAADHGMVVAQASDLDRAEIEKIVRDYLVSNPEILTEMQQALDAKEREEQRLAHIAAIQGAKDEIFNSAYDGVVGNPQGKVTIVEFYDYNCGFCKRAQDDMVALTAEDPELRFVLKEFPILGPDSQKAHVVSMAVHKLMPEKFEQFHNELIGAKGRANEEAAMKIAISLGADEAKLREAMKDESITKEFARTYELANKLAITGTPSYVVGTEVVYGALGQDVLREKIAAVKASCTEAAC